MKCLTCIPFSDFCMYDCNLAFIYPSCSFEPIFIRLKLSKQCKQESFQEGSSWGSWGAGYCIVQVLLPHPAETAAFYLLGCQVQIQTAGTSPRQIFWCSHWSMGKGSREKLCFLEASAAAVVSGDNIWLNESCCSVQLVESQYHPLLFVLTAPFGWGGLRSLLQQDEAVIQLVWEQALPTFSSLQGLPGPALSPCAAWGCSLLSPSNAAPTTPWKGL